MHLLKAKELNERIIEECNSKVEKSLDARGFDNECFEILSQAIDNLMDIEKIEKYEVKEKTPMAKEKFVKKDAKTEVTEFEQLIYDICQKGEYEEKVYAYTTVIAETMEDLRQLHPRFYQTVMRNLKELLY